MTKNQEESIKTSLTLNADLWAKFKRSADILGMSDRAATEDAMTLWLRDRGPELAIAHRNAANEAERIPARPARIATGTRGK